MSSAGPVHPLPDSRASVDAAAKVLTRALFDDPGFSHVMPEPEFRQTALLAVHRLALRDGLRHGRVLTVDDAQGVAGVAVWYPPHSYPMSWRRKCRAVPGVLPVALRAPRRAFELARFATAIERALHAAVPDDGAWYLEVLGVRPDAQRRGYGRRLVTPVLEEADRTGAACYLETSRDENVAMYTALGFQVVGEIGPLYPGGPSEARMLRPASKAPVAP